MISTGPDYSAKLRRSANTILDASGNGQIALTPDTATQSWRITRIAVRTSQSPVQTPFPQAEVFDSQIPVPANSLGATASGHNDVYDSSGSPIEIGTTDTLLIVWTAGIPGTTATAIIRGYLYGAY